MNTIKQLIYLSLFLFFLFIVSIYLLWIIYYKVKHPFWSCQPVFHVHHLTKWFYTPYIVYKNTFPITKYYNKYNIIVTPLNQSLNQDKSKYTDLLSFYSYFIKKFYSIDNNDNSTYYAPSSDSLHLSLSNQRKTSYIAYYFTYSLLARTIEKTIHSIISFKHITMLLIMVNMTYISPECGHHLKKVTNN